MKDYIARLMRTRLLFTCKRMQSGLVFMMVMEARNVLNFSNKSCMNTFLILTGERMCLMLFERLSSTLMTNGRKKVTIVVVVLLLFLSTTTCAT